MLSRLLVATVMAMSLGAAMASPVGRPADRLGMVERDEDATQIWPGGFNGAEPDEISAEGSKRDNDAVALWPSHVDKAEPDEVAPQKQKRGSRAVNAWLGGVNGVEPDEVPEEWERANNEVEK